ncbi:hypothetical protein [Bosea sp. RAC05]|uniref:hypothetical protein n=1 Tax=Bosea sp. RAC05 TaxID=1842539 RepID=UPI00083DBE31|nr:hypothetical protein [Bosea sp. RAC05]AOG02856.1 hypothetical protein BSY19_5343 [Bosea sp. RAC05]
MERLTTDGLVDAAFEAVFGGDQDQAKLRSTLVDAVGLAVSTMPRDMASRLRASGPVLLRAEGCTIRCHLPSRGVTAVRIGLDGGSIHLQIEAWRGRPAGTITSCDMIGRYQAELALTTLARAWRRILLVTDQKRADGAGAES